LSDVSVESLVPEDLRECTIEEFLVGMAAHDAHMRSLHDAAARDSKRLRYVGRLTAAGQATVAIERVDAIHPFAKVASTDNIVRFVTDRYSDNPLIVQGPGAGPAVTAGGNSGRFPGVTSRVSAVSQTCVSFDSSRSNAGSERADRSEFCGEGFFVTRMCLKSPKLAREAIQFTFTAAGDPGSSQRCKARNRMITQELIPRSCLYSSSCHVSRKVQAELPKTQLTGQVNSFTCSAIAPPPRRTAKMLFRYACSLLQRKNFEHKLPQQAFGTKL
jgi:hypothetical protein